MPGRMWLKDNHDGTVSLPYGKTLTGGSAIAETAMKRDSGLLAVGNNGVYGAPTTILPLAGFNAMDIEKLSYVLGGMFDVGGENVTVKITATFDDDTTADYIPAAFTGTGTTAKTETDYGSVWIVEGKRIKKLQVYCKTDLVMGTMITAKIIAEGEYVV